MQFLQCPALPNIIQCALLACSLDHKEANASVMKFFYDLIGIAHCGKMEPDYKTRKVITNTKIKYFFILKFILITVSCKPVYKGIWTAIIDEFDSCMCVLFALIYVIGSG